MITIRDSNFTENQSPRGAAIYATDSSKISYLDHILFDRNSANNSYGVVYLSNSEFGGHETGSITFSNNIGSLTAFSSNITFTGHATFVNNQPSKTASGDFQEGGAITLSRAMYTLMEYALLNSTLLKMVEQYRLLTVNSM